MNAYNRRAEVAATLTNTMGRQKTRLFSVPAKSCRREREGQWVKRERDGRTERRCNERATEEKRGTFAGQRTCIICGRRSATVSRWPFVFATVVGSQGGLRLNCFRLAAKLSGRGETAPKPPRFIYANFCTHAITREKTAVALLSAMKRWDEPFTVIKPIDAPSPFLWNVCNACVKRCFFFFFFLPPPLQFIAIYFRTCNWKRALIFEINFRRTNYKFFFFFLDGISNFVTKKQERKRYFLFAEQNSIGDF